MRRDPPTTVLAAFGSLQMTTLSDDAVARSSSAIKFIMNESDKGLDIFIKVERITYKAAAISGFGLNGIAIRKTVERSCVRTIPPISPNRFEMRGERPAANPITIYVTASRGPEKTSVAPKRR